MWLLQNGLTLFSIKDVPSRWFLPQLFNTTQIHDGVSFHYFFYHCDFCHFGTWISAEIFFNYCVTNCLIAKIYLRPRCSHQKSHIWPASLRFLVPSFRDPCFKVSYKCSFQGHGVRSGTALPASPRNKKIKLNMMLWKLKVTISAVL